ncbi:hypothetical protein H6P81_013177 [Aristolochia fimbriata]|uniref:Uncharacterized protein n=1 Tax=Aristolochia fimbriata TaxID=158543 RepID=A0AAV7EEB5_ARIFI|nr:hypothetical protein H6P81_013177 [Aristolochia fimbriata]
MEKREEGEEGRRREENKSPIKRNGGCVARSGNAIHFGVGERVERSGAERKRWKDDAVSEQQSLGCFCRLRKKGDSDSFNSLDSDGERREPSYAGKRTREGRSSAPRRLPHVICTVMQNKMDKCSPNLLLCLIVR